MISDNWAIVVHGGAGVHPERSYARAECALAQVLLSARERLASGAAALDIAELAVAAMEDTGLFVAGRGAAPNLLGEVELDAGIMDGATGRAGAVCALQGIASPVGVARRILDASPHVLLAAEGARRFAMSEGLPGCGDLESWLRRPDGFDPSDLDDGHGTVGAVVLDRHGRLAAATSTGGTYGAAPGRVGDTPVVGAGVWADETIAVSCTGAGEAFLNSAAAHDLVCRMRYAGEPLDKAATAVLGRVAALGGDGGLVALSREGEVVAPFNSPGMKRGWAGARLPAAVGSTGQRMIPAVQALCYADATSG